MQSVRSFLLGEGKYWLRPALQWLTGGLPKAPGFLIAISLHLPLNSRFGHVFPFPLLDCPSILPFQPLDLPMSWQPSILFAPACHAPPSCRHNCKGRQTSSNDWYRYQVAKHRIDKVNNIFLLFKKGGTTCRCLPIRLLSKKKGEVDQSMCPSDEQGLETNVYLLRTENWRECFRHELLWLDQCLTFSPFILSSFLLVNSSAKNYYGDVYSKQSLELKYMFFIRRSKMFLPSGNVW